MSGLLDGKVALITGAGSGQGRAASLLFTREGAAGIAVIDVNDDGAAETIGMVEDAGGKAVAVHADVSRRADCDAMVDATMAAFGRIDVLYNNAAIQMSGRLVDTTEEQWDVTIATNLNAIFWACRAAIPHMRDGGGSIINTASVLGLIGSEGYAAYGAAKAGLVALTRQIAVEHGPRIRANVIAPGSIDTPRFRKVIAEMGGEGEGFLEGLTGVIPLQRLGTADDIARVALFLASDASAYTSGAVLPCDGGLAALR